MTGDRRKEMRNIRDLVTAGDLDTIAEQTRAMKRLWDNSVLPGLHTRRNKEAEIIASAPPIKRRQKGEGLRRPGMDCRHACLCVARRQVLPCPKQGRTNGEILRLL